MPNTLRVKKKKKKQNPKMKSGPRLCVAVTAHPGPGPAAGNRPRRARGFGSPCRPAPRNSQRRPCGTRVTRATRQPPPTPATPHPLPAGREAALTAAPRGYPGPAGGPCCPALQELNPEAGLRGGRGPGRPCHPSRALPPVLIKW